MEQGQAVNGDTAAALLDKLAHGSFDESDTLDGDFGSEGEEDEIDVTGQHQRLWRFLCTPIVEVLVGPSERRFWLHRGLLRHHSFFFRKMLRSSAFQEGKTQSVKLPDDDAAAFSAFAEWLYVGHEADSGDISVDISEQDDDIPGATQPDVAQLGEPLEPRTPARLQKRSNKGESEGDCRTADDEDEKHNDSYVDSTARHDSYDFSFQFSCYVLADKLLAPKFKEHILEEIRFYGEFCDSSVLLPDLVRYVYKNTADRDDPLRKFCIALKCVETPIHETLSDPEFQVLMEEGGAIVRDVMELCRKSAEKEEWHDPAENTRDGDGI